MPAPDLADPPAAVRKQLDALAKALDPLVPPKAPGNLLIGTWNLALLGGLTEAWETPPRASPKRNFFDVCAIAEVVRRFDVCAIQEVKRDLTALRALLAVLGDGWTFITTDVTEGDPGNAERLAFVYQRDRVHASGLVGEIVIPATADGKLVGALDRQFARTPYAVSFAAGEKAFTLVTLHTLYGKGGAGLKRRRLELQAIAEWLADRADDEDAFNRNLIALGDFNIDRLDDPLFQAFASTGLAAPEALNEVPRNISASKRGTEKFYDQIAWFTKGTREALTLEYVTAGGVKWTDLLLADAKSNADRKAHISDHYPLWAEFGR
jgi:endonuclease/exonuclease/phosphatase family metal-dependent hydrolase